MFSSRKQRTETTQAEPFKQNAGISTPSTYPSIIQSNSEVPVISPRKSKGEIQRKPLGLKGKVLSLGRVQKKNERCRKSSTDHAESSRWKDT